MGVVLVAALCASSARADALIAYTSFEEPAIPVNVSNVPASTYDDLGDAGADHALANTPGYYTPVVYSSVGGELGFSAYYGNSRNGAGLADNGSLVGVNSFSNSTVLAATDGTQKYLLADIDGRLTVTLDSVDLTGAVAPEISLDYFFRSSSYESEDYGRIWVVVDDGLSTSEITLLDTRGGDIDDLNLEGVWTSVSATLPTGAIATLMFEADTDTAAEMMGVDNIKFTAVPEPSTMGLLVLAGAMLLLRTRFSRAPLK
jgi:hypothetical protein